MQVCWTISRGAVAGALLFCAAAPAGAASSPWFEHEGGNLRVVTSGAGTAGGVLRGVLQIDLQPGWHTYWRDPGDTGVAPSIEVSPSAAPVEVGFPAPSRLDDGSAGYAGPVSLPLTIRPAKGQEPLQTTVFLGLCREICIPVEARLAVDPADGADDPVDATTVADAFAALPAAPSAGFGVTARVSSPLEIVAEATLPSGATGAELFMAGDARYALGAPKKLSETSGRAVFGIAVLSYAAATHSAAAFRYVLKAGGKAVEGTVTLPAL